MPLVRRKRSVQRTQQWVSATAELGFDYCLKRSNRRRSVAISVKNNQVNLMAPPGIAAKELHQWLVEKAPWVREKLHAQKARCSQVPDYDFTPGSVLPLLGERYSLEIGVVASRKAKLEFLEREDESCFSLALPEFIASDQSKRFGLIRGLFERFYKARAHKLLIEKTLNYCEQLNLECADVRFRRTKSKWGHCTSAGVIQYNWLIVQAPEFVVDYLAAHEVCHLKHHNHSQAFWQLVEGVCPNYREAKLWLKEQGHTLTL